LAIPLLPEGSIPLAKKSKEKIMKRVVIIALFFSGCLSHQIRYLNEGVYAGFVGLDVAETLYGTKHGMVEINGFIGKKSGCSINCIYGYFWNFNLRCC
jgi:hypothetical protein